MTLKKNSNTKINDKGSYKAKHKRRIFNKAGNISNKFHSYLCEGRLYWSERNYQQSSGKLFKINDN